MLDVRRINGLELLRLMLRGGVQGGKVLSGQSFYLDGKTFIIGAETVTFDSAGAQVALSLTEVLAAINAQATSYRATLSRNGMLIVNEVTPGSGVTVDKDGTANADLGFPVGQDVVGIVYGAPGAAAPSLVSVEPTSGSEDTYILVTNEA